MTGDAAVLSPTRVTQSACLACLFCWSFCDSWVISTLDSRSPLRAHQAGFGHADLVKTRRFGADV